jgi:hypothetical protein
MPRTRTSGPNGGGGQPKERNILAKQSLTTRGRGQATKLSEELIKNICELVERGLPINEASVLCGTHWTSVYNWRAAYPQVDLLLSEAEAKATSRAVNRLMNEIDDPQGDWKAALEYLKRRRKEDWSDRQELWQQHDGQVEIVVRYDDSKPKDG